MSSQDEVDAAFDDLEEELPTEEGEQASPNQEVDPEAAAEAPNEERATDDAAATATNGSCEKAEEHEGAEVANAGKTEAVSSTSAPDEPTASAPAKPAPKMRRLELKKTAAPATTEKGKASKPVNSPGKVAKENVRTEDKTSEDDTNDQPSNQQDAAKEAPTVAAKKVKLPTFKSKAASGPPDPATFKVKKASEVAVKKKTSGASSGGKEKKDKKDKKPRAKTSYMFFCADNRTTLAEQEGLGFTEVSKRLGEIWKTLPEEEKAPYAAQAAADHERIAQLEGAAEGGASTSVSKPKAKRSKPDKKKSVSKAASDNEDDEDATPEEDTVDAAAKAVAKKKRKNDKRSRESRKRKRSAAKGDEEAGGDDAEDDDGSDYDWQRDHEEVDWAAHPAECILAITTQGKYVVKRRGMPLQEFGLVDAATARRKAGEGNGGAAGAVVPAALINEFEGSRKRFEKETTAHTLSRELDLDDLEDGSMLEACAFLGDLRREGLLDRKGLKQWSFADDKMSVPVMTFVVQRLLECERREKAQLQKQLDHAIACAGKNLTPLPTIEE